MARAAYNVTAAVYTGFDAVPPFEYRFSLEGRLVPNRRTLLMASTWLAFTHYFNWDGTEVVPGETSFDGTDVSWDVLGADVLEVPEFSGELYLVLYVGTIDTPAAGDSPYRRAWLLKL